MAAPTPPSIVPDGVSRILLVSSLPPSTNSAAIYQLFGEYGPLRQVRLGSDALTRGTAIVVFEQCLDAKEAVEQLHGRKLAKTRSLHVEYFKLDKFNRLVGERKRRRERDAELRERKDILAGVAAQPADGAVSS